MTTLKGKKLREYDKKVIEISNKITRAFEKLEKEYDVEFSTICLLRREDKTWRVHSHSK